MRIDINSPIILTDVKLDEMTRKQREAGVTLYRARFLGTISGSGIGMSPSEALAKLLFKYLDGERRGEEVTFDRAARYI